jgi:hypothetical protein
MESKKLISRREALVSSAICLGLGIGVGNFLKMKANSEAEKPVESNKTETQVTLDWMSARVEQAPNRFSRKDGDYFAHVNVYLDNSKPLYQEFAEKDPHKITLALNCGTCLPELEKGDTVWFDLYSGFRPEVVQVDAYSVKEAYRVFDEAKGNLRDILRNPNQ